MKKLLLLAILLFGTITFAQETFILKYTSFITKEDNVIQPERFMNVTVVFNEKKTTDVVLYYDSGATIRYNTYGGTEKVTTKGGEKTQTVKALDSADGKEVLLQLFESTGTLRIIIANGWFIEFYK